MLPTTTTNDQSICQTFTSPGGPLITLPSHPQPGPVTFPTDISSYAAGTAFGNISVPWPSTGDKQGLYYTTMTGLINGQEFFESVFPQEAAFSNCRWADGNAPETDVETALLLTETHTSFEDEVAQPTSSAPAPPANSPGNSPANTTPEAPQATTSANPAGGIASVIGSAAAQASKTSAAGAQATSGAQGGSGGGSPVASSSGSGSSNNNGGASNQGGSTGNNAGSSTNNNGGAAPNNGGSSGNNGASNNGGLAGAIASAANSAASAENTAGANAGVPSSSGSSATMELLDRAVAQDPNLLS